MKLKVLVAEHEADVLALLVSSFKTAGYEIISATNGLLALKRSCAVLPDLIILDALLPDIDGRAVCEILRRLPSTASIPLLMLTAPSDQAPDMGPTVGQADGYVTKPFLATELVLRAKEMLLRREEMLWPGNHLESAYPLAGDEP